MSTTKNKLGNIMNRKHILQQSATIDNEYAREVLNFLPRTKEIILNKRKFLPLFWTMYQGDMFILAKPLFSTDYSRDAAFVFRLNRTTNKFSILSDPLLTSKIFELYNNQERTTTHGDIE